MALILAGLSALFYGVADFSGGLAAARSRLLSVLILSQAMGLTVAVAGLAFLGHDLPPVRDLGWGLLAGITGALGLFMLYGGLARSLVAVVSPLSALVGAVIPVLFAVCMGERPTPNALAGCLLCLPAILLLSWERGGGPQDRRLVRSAVAYGGLAGLGFGMFF
ncbi:MAG TPA: EamA family transporter, partial [Holophaga sp.]|nr:EamA family transporter [Holophaga sp.]